MTGGRRLVDRTGPIAGHGRLLVFVAVVLGHWTEHLVQAAQIYWLGRSKEQALGLLGMVVPELVRSEWLHWGYNLAVLLGLWLLLPRFAGPARGWWKAALVVQAWHFVEHALLLVQALTSIHLLGAEAPTSVVQLLVPRVELHLFYNGVVTALLLVGAGLRVAAEDRAVRQGATALRRDQRLVEGSPGSGPLAP